MEDQTMTDAPPPYSRDADRVPQLSDAWRFKPDGDFEVNPGTTDLKNQFEAFTTRQLGMSSFDTLHTVELVYPGNQSRQMLDSVREEEIIFPPLNVSNRLEPKPLVDHSAIMVHTGWEDPEETRYCVYEPTNRFKTITDYDPYTLMPPVTLANADPRNRLYYFARYMDWAMRFVGKTTISVIAYKYVGPNPKVGSRWHDPSDGYLRFNVKTVFRSPQGVEIPHPRRAGIQTDFRWFYLLRRRPIWWYGMMDLIHRITDRAHKHVLARANMIQVHFDSEPQDWKRARVPDVANEIHRVLDLVDPATLDAGNSSCWICSNDYDDDLHRPFRLRCEHIICEACVLGIVRTITSRESVCPFCRVEIFTNEEVDTLVALTLCLKGDGLFHEDDRYDDWENNQRSFADLDIRKAENVDERFEEPYYPRLVACLHLFFMNNVNEQAETMTARYQQPCFFIEMFEIYRALDTYITNLHNGPAVYFPTPSTLLPQLLHYVRSHLETRMRAGTIGPLMPGAGLDEIGRPRPLFFLRPGIEVYYERMLSRAVMMVLKRKCDNPDHWEAQTEGYLQGRDQKFHFHGSRMFYCSAEAKAEAVGRQMSGLGVLVRRMGGGSGRVEKPARRGSSRGVRGSGLEGAGLVSRR